MPRPKRVCMPGLPHHVVQRGNNKQATFYDAGDYQTYLNLLRDAAASHGIGVHAFVLMTNHVHLLMTPSSCNGLSLIMQSIGRSYVGRINKKHNRSGTLWEGRFKCSVVETDRYCLACYRYIDLNPVRANIVKDPGDYRWSSYRHNALGEVSSFLTQHASYDLLGKTAEARMAEYRRIVMNATNNDAAQAIRYGIRKGIPTGSKRFKYEIEAQLGIRIGEGIIGRPRKSRTRTKKGSDPI